MRTVLIDELIAWEVERFQANEYRGRADAPEFEFASGRIPALVSAPHAVTHMRDGTIKPSEDFMGAIALAVAQVAECHALVATRTGDGDPNWDPFERSPYKQALCRYVAEHDIKLVLDLHGMVAASEDLVAVGSADGSTVMGGFPRGGMGGGCAACDVGGVGSGRHADGVDGVGSGRHADGVGGVGSGRHADGVGGVGGMADNLPASGVSGYCVAGGESGFRPTSSVSGAHPTGGVGKITEERFDERAHGVLCSTLEPWCRKHGKPITLNGRLGARGENTIARTIARECQVTALQIEVATQLRIPANLHGHVPKGEKIPFSNKQLPVEIAARRAANPEAVLALIEALATICCEGVL